MLPFGGVRIGKKVGHWLAERRQQQHQFASCANDGNDGNDGVHSGAARSGSGGGGRASVTSMGPEQQASARCLESNQEKLDGGAEDDMGNCTGLDTEDETEV